MSTLRILRVLERCDRLKSIVNITDMYKSFFGVIAMDGMDFDVREGEIHCLVGENGCGKSSMIKVISGFYTFDRGQLHINGKEYRKITPSESMREGIQVIYQDFSLFPNMTIAENIMMYDTVGTCSFLISQDEQFRKARQVLDRIRFDIDPYLYVHQLNIAQMQMVAICRAIAQDARLIIMDEPTTALTTSEVSKLFQVVQQLKDQGVAVLFVSHKLDEILQISDRITVMRNGKSVFVSQEDQPLPSKEELIFHMTGKSFAKPAANEAIDTDLTPIMELKHYGLKDAFEDISFKLYPGEILGITGLLGCGRQELAESLFGIVQATEGRLLIQGKEMRPFRSVQEAVAQRIAYVPEDRMTKGLHMEQSIADNAIARIIEQFRNRLGLISGQKMAKGKERALTTVHIRGMRPYNPVRSLSGGNQQKVGLVKWLASKPLILVLNCPTVGVDVGAKEDIHDIIRGLAGEGIGVIVISDDIPEVLHLCDRILVMKKGRIAHELRADDMDIDGLESMLAEDEDLGEVS